MQCLRHEFKSEGTCWEASLLAEVSLAPQPAPAADSPLSPPPARNHTGNGENVICSGNINKCGGLTFIEKANGPGNIASTGRVVHQLFELTVRG